MLTAEDMAEIRRLLDRRDQHLKRLYAQIHGLGTRLAKARDGSLLQAIKRRVHDFETLTTWRVTAPLRALKKRLSGRS